MVSWSISVKTVGGDNTATNSFPPHQASKPTPTNFTVQVESNASITSLHREIENITGLKMSQQRLIYRGRLISTGLEHESSPGVGTECIPSTINPRICDIEGLNDGQTIHLVPRPSVDLLNPNSTADTGESEVGANDSFDPGTSITGDVGAGLLSALLSLGTGGVFPIQGGEVGVGTLGSFRQSRTRAARMAARRRRANSHRKTSSDPRYPQPGPLEPVRQGLLTLHTMIGSQTDSQDSHIRHPLDAPRRFFRGQWIDVRDTVNQWLEATVVEILSPEDILKLPAQTRTDSSSSSVMKKRLFSCPTDSAVGVNDLEGRRRLLLEQCGDDFDRNSLARITGDETLNGFRERDNNLDVQLLLIHYNGWPHRWDEWIRSDSERIRPFRTRSKNAVGTSTICPVPQNDFYAAPSTYIANENDSLDRPYLIPELRRALVMVTDLFSAAIDNSYQPDSAVSSVSPDNSDQRLVVDSAIQNSMNDYESSRMNQSLPPDNIIAASLPWLQTIRPSKNDRCGEIEEESSEAEKQDDISTSISRLPIISTRYNKRKLELLAPLLDRLGRVLIDTAPHVAALADSLSAGEKQSIPTESLMETTRISSSPPSVDVGLPDIEVVEEILPQLPTSSVDENETLDDEELDDDAVKADPDHADFVNGFVNFSNSDVVTARTGLRRDSRSSSIGLGTSLFSNIEDDSGTSAPRVIRLGGSNSGVSGGNGIDIHIHAIVTGTGLGAFGGAAPILSGLHTLNDSPQNQSIDNTAPPSTMIAETIRRVDEEDLGLFSRLYTDDPPVAASIHDCSSNTYCYQSEELVSSEGNTTADSLDHDMTSAEKDIGSAHAGNAMDQSASIDTKYRKSDVSDCTPPSSQTQKNESTISDVSVTSSSGRSRFNTGSVSVGTQTTSTNYSVETTPSRTSLGQVFRRALGRSNR